MKYFNLDYFGRQSSVEYFSKVQHLKHSLLLDSGNAINDNNRYDIILARPEQVLISKNQQHFICTSHSKEKVSVADSFEQINQWLSEFQAIDDQPNLPFTGGVAGVIGYDMGRSLETIPNIAEKSTSIPDLVLGLYFCPLIIDHQQQIATLYCFHQQYIVFDKLIADFTNQSNDAKLEGTSINVSQPNNKDFDASRNDKKLSNTSFRLTSQWRSNMTEDEYAKKFSKVKQYIKSGDCYQINLAQRFNATYQGSEWDAYQQLSSINKAPFSAFFRMSDCCLISLSPERFIKKYGDTVITQPIKGTRRRDENQDIDESLALELTNSTKDRAENLMIVDLLRNDLSRTAQPGSVKVTELFGLHSFPSVHHLISTIEAKPKPEYTAADVIKMSFPGGSITGAPKIRAMEIIEELEPHRRHFYCGSISYFSFNGNMDSSILIRSLVTHEQSIYTWAGGGLVDDSICDEEYAETFTKLSKILSPLEKHLDQQPVKQTNDHVKS